MVVQSSFHFESFCEERSSQSNHAGMQRPCATQSELSLSCSGALNARSECSITGPEPRACTSTGCTGSTATSLQDGTTVAIPRKEMIMASFHFGTFRLGSREQKLFSILSFRPRQKKTGVFEQASSKLFDLFGYFILSFRPRQKKQEFRTSVVETFRPFRLLYIFCEAWAQPLWL